MTPADDDRDDPFAHLLGATDRGTAPPDRAFLERLREQSAAAFLASYEVSPLTTTLSPEAGQREKNQPSPPKGRAMLTRFAGALAATAALLLVVAIYYQKPQKPIKPAEPLALGTALESVTGAKSVHLKVTRDGKADSEIWSEKGGRMRVENGTGFVTLSDGELVWRLDEKTGKA